MRSRRKQFVDLEKTKDDGTNHIDPSSSETFRIDTSRCTYLCEPKIAANVVDKCYIN